MPVETPSNQHRLEEILDVVLADDRLAWELAGDGRWHKVPDTGAGIETHSRLQELALGRTRRRDA